jgi:hypothetical protein
MTNNQKRFETVAMLKNFGRDLEYARRMLPTVDAFEAGHLWAVIQSLEALIRGLQAKAENERTHRGVK